MCKAKATGHYVNSVLAFHEARKSGYDDAIMLDSLGCIAEASSSNVFIVRKGVVYTPTDMSILQGITRETVITLCKDLDLECFEKNITRDEVYTADEMFVAGTAAEIKAVGELDNRKIATGLRGPITKKIQAAFQKVVLGEDSTHLDWLTPVN